MRAPMVTRTLATAFALLFVLQIAAPPPEVWASATRSQNDSSSAPAGLAGNSIAFRASANASATASTTLLVTKPAGVASGDALLAAVSVRGTPTITPPSGWSLIRSDPNTTVMTQALYVKVAGGSEPANYTWTFGASASAAVGGILAYTGVDPLNPVDTSGGQANASSSSITAPSVTTNVSDELLLGAFGTGNNPTFTAPADMTERFQLSAVGTNKIGLDVADVARPSAGATGTRVATGTSSAANIGQLVGLRQRGSVPSNNAPTPLPGTVRTVKSTAIVITLSATDPETCELTFAAVASPSHGSLGAITNQTCASGSPNGDGATLTYTPTAGYTGQDSFTFKANDGTTDGAAATVGITVRDPDTNLGLQGQHSLESWGLGGGDSLSVNVSTGNAVISHPLVSLPLRGSSLSISLTYNAQDSANVGIGPGWRLDLQRRLTVNADSTVTLAAADGSRHTFTNPQTVGTVTTYTRPATLYATLVKDTSQTHPWALTYKDQSVDRFDTSGSSGLLVRAEERHGDGVTLAYGSGTDISTVTDDTSRQLSFTWDTGSSPHRLSSFTDWAWISGSGIVQTSATGSHRSYRFFYDGSGNLAGWADPLNTSGSCTLGASHVTCLTYTSGLVSAIVKTQTFASLLGSTLGTTARAVQTDIAYNGAGVSTVTDAEQHAQGSPKRTTFTSLAASKVRVDRPTTTMTYVLVAADDPYARITSVLRQADATTQYEQRTVWDTTYPIEPASVTDNYGALFSTPARAVSTTYVASSLANVAKIVEPLTGSTNRWTEFVYNAHNDVTQETISLDGSGTNKTVSRSCYDASCTTSGNGNDLLATIADYVSGGATDEDTNVKLEYAYDAYGEMTSETRHNRDGAGATRDDRVTGYEYDGSGNQTKSILNYANGTVTSPGDDVTPNATTGARTDLTAAFGYDTAGNQISVADPRRAILAATGSPAADDYVSRSTFDALDQSVTETTPTTPGITITQQTATSTYDEAGQVRAAADFAGQVTATAFDRAGRPVTMYEVPAGSATASTTAQMTVDADGRVKTAMDRAQVADSARGMTIYGYNDLGLQDSLIEAYGTSEERETDQSWDALDRLRTRTTGVASPAAAKTRYTLDVGGRVLTTDDGFACSSATYDYRDPALTTTDGLAGTTCASAADTRVSTNTIDGLGRVTRSEVTSGTGTGDRTIDLTLDGAEDTLTSATKKSGTTVTTTFSVNLLDQVQVEARPDGSTAKSNYDPVANVADKCYWQSGATVGSCLAVGTTPWTNPPTSSTTSTFDARNNLVSLQDSASTQTTVYDATQNYQPAAVYLPTSGGKETQVLYGYDNRHRLTGITLQLCTISTGHACSSTVSQGSDTYLYDENDNRTKVVEDNGNTSSDRRYCYDANNQLIYRNTAAACSSGAKDEANTFDDAGNRLTAVAGGVTTNFAYTSDGQLCDVETAPTTASCSGGNVTYDTAGRTATYNGWWFIYDAEGRLISACKSSSCAAGFDKVEFAYDGEGHRTQIKTTSAAGAVATTEFRYQSDAIVEEKLTDATHAGVVVRSYVVDESGSVVKMIIPATEANPGTYLPTWNGHGDALNLSKLDPATGTLTLANSYSYSSWGAPTTATHNSIPDLGFRFLYVGEFDVQWDNAFGLGLHYMHARHYGPGLGRFLQPDPTADEAYLFGYASNNPVTSSDPAGTCGWCQRFEQAGGEPGRFEFGRYRQFKAWEARRNLLSRTWRGGDRAAVRRAPIHGNSLDSPRRTTLYALYKGRQFLKWGITSAAKICEGRYGRGLMLKMGWRCEVIAAGTRRAMAELERRLVLTKRGPLNFERWR
jgi:RHS repeat-associated protein